MSKTGDQLQAEAHAPTKVQADAARGKVRDTHASRSARARSDPKVAKVVDDACAGLDEAKPPKNKGGRPQGSKNRSPAVVARDRILRVINKLGETWMHTLAKDEPYLFIQLVKRVIPNTAPVAAPDTEEHTVRIQYVKAPLPTEDRKYEVEFDKPDGNPIPLGSAKLDMQIETATQEQYDARTPNPHLSASDEPAPTTDSVSSADAAKPVPKVDVQQLTAEAVLDAAKHGDQCPERSKLRRLIAEAAHGFNSQLLVKVSRQAAELKKLRARESQESKMRMYAENAGSEEGWSGGGGNW